MNRFLFIYLFTANWSHPWQIKVKNLFSKVKKNMQPQSPYLHLNISKYFNCADFWLLFKE